MEPELMFTNGLEEYIKNILKTFSFQIGLVGAPFLVWMYFFPDAFSCKKMLLGKPLINTINSVPQKYYWDFLGQTKNYLLFCNKQSALLAYH